MSEGNNNINNNNDDNKNRNSSTSSSSNPPRGRGRGGGGGGRGRGRRGRGGGRGAAANAAAVNSNTSSAPADNNRFSNKQDEGATTGSTSTSFQQRQVQRDDSTPTTTTTSTSTATPHSSPQLDGRTAGRFNRGGGRGGQARGRGRGRGRGRNSSAGRGGRGRGRRSRSKSPLPANADSNTLTQDMLHQQQQPEQQPTSATDPLSATTTPTTTSDAASTIITPTITASSTVTARAPSTAIASTNASTSTSTSTTANTLPTPVLQLPPIPLHARSQRKGVPILLSRKNTPQPATTAIPNTASTASASLIDDPNEQHMQHLSERLAEAALAEDDQHQDQETPQVTSTEANSLDKHKKQRKKKDPARKKKSRLHSNKSKESSSFAPDEESNLDDDDDDEPDVSTTDAIQKLPAQHVSITASTAIKVMRRSEDTATSLTTTSSSLSSSTTPQQTLKNSSSSAALKKRRNKTKGLLANDDTANQKAARRFNNTVRAAVERGDPDLLRSILQDKANHKFALEAIVLETVMKAYVMAALFDDALYLLRNCTLPETLTCSATERILQCLPQNLRNSSAYTAADMINALCIATQFDDNSQQHHHHQHHGYANGGNNASSSSSSSTTRTYFLRIVRGIALEFLEEATSARDRICSSACERLVRSAVCVVNARLKRGKKVAELVVDPGDQLGVFVPDTMENRGIQAGDAVSILPYAGPYPMSAESLDRNMVEATVTNTNPMVLRLQDKTNADLYSLLTEPMEGNVYRIDKLANRMGFNRQLAAAVAICHPTFIAECRTRDPRRPCPQLIKAITAMDENIDRVMRASNNERLPRGELTSTAALCAEAIPWNAEEEEAAGQQYNGGGVDQDSLRASSKLALEKYGALEGLNASQQLAVEGAVTNRLTLVQGPPGTGKTAVAIRILQHWARLAVAAVEKGESPAPILATSDSNIAVDNLVEGCAGVGLRVVRLGRPEAIRPELLRFCIDKPTSSSRENGLNQPNNNNNFYGNNSSGGVNFKERAKQLKNAQIICCTCIGSGGDILDALGPLDRVLVDEATQATEPAVLVPLMRGCRQLVLVGDHCQLPPTVLSTKAEEEGHGVPLFSRMVACGVPPFMLDTQYRMHPAISMFPSDLFYGGLLKNGVSAPERRPLAGFPWPREEFPVAFMPIVGDEMDDGVSKFNEAEAEAAFHTVQMLLEGGQCSVSDIAVVTPYAAQARLIRRMLRTIQRSPGPPYIEVSSVDGFQGREKEAVVFSAVRSNDYGAIGFTSDWRRVNVSFTRARRALIVIGNDVTLRRGDPDTWNPWLSWAEAYGLNMDRPGQPRGRYDAEQLRRVRGGTTAAEMLKDVLERQQAQLKTAQQQQERAVRNAEGHIIATAEENNPDDAVAGADAARALTLEEDLAMLENTQGNWDDSDDEENVLLRHSVSKGTLTSASSSADLRSATWSSTPIDAWDL